ncbi:MAG: hypothetical protein IJS63_00275, partial [Bacteroidaceae bacterium]|nr:hypothetical protein [Bacteroidaceae bacterium]
PVTYDENASDNEIVPHTYYNKVVLNKTFVNDEWQFVCFPFSLNAADIETIFGKGTIVEQLEVLEIDVKEHNVLKSNSNEWSDDEHDGLYYRIVSEMEAGCPYLIRPTNALTSPITLEHVQITRDAPWVYSQEYSYIRGTFQKTDEAPAFSAYIIDDPNGIEEIHNSKFKIQNEDAWYDLSGKQLLNGKSSNGKRPKSIYVTKGRKMLFGRLEK